MKYYYGLMSWLWIFMAGAALYYHCVWWSAAYFLNSVLNAAASWVWSKRDV